MDLSITASASRMQIFGALFALFAAGAACGTAHAQTYVPDPTWNSGLIGPDNFASALDYRRGQKVARGDNGDVIVAGIVPGVGTAGGHTKVGLVRYNHAGIRQTWSNAGANGFNSNQYVIAPCANSTNCGDDKDVKGIYRFGSRIFVLVDAEGFLVGVHPGIPPIPYTYPAPTAAIYVFGIDGSLQSATTVDSDAYAGDGSRTVTGGGIAVYDNASFPSITTLVYAGTGITDVYRPRYARFTVESSGALTTQTETMEPAFGGLCAPGDYCQFTGIATGGRPTTNGAPRLYISGLRWHPGPGPGTIGWDAGWDLFVASVNSTGTPRTSFATSGIYTTEGIGSQSAGEKIAVNPSFSITGNDEIFVVGDVELACRHGITVLKLNQDGTRANTFGNNGQVMYGGSSQTNIATCNLGWRNRSIRIDYPTDIVYADDLLGVSGLNIYGPGVTCIIGQPCPENNVDGEVAVIDANTGAINSWRGYAYSDTVGGARSRHSGFYGISTAGDGTFSVAGDVRYFETAPAAQAGKMMFATLRVAPLSDVIFKDGFDVIHP